MTRAATAILLAIAAAGCAAAPLRPFAGEDPIDGGYPIEEGYGGPGPRRRSWEDIDRIQTALMPYAWRATGRGESVVRDVPVRFDEEGGSRDSDLSWGGRAEIYSERVGFFLDGFFTSVSHDEPGVEYDDRYAVFDIGSAMRLAGGDPWDGPGERPALDFEFDGLALIRTHWLKMDATPAGAFTSATDDAFWADLVFGVRGALVVAGRLGLYGKIDGGGMALDEWQSWTWSGEVGARLRITRNLVAVAAYRWYGSHWEDGNPDEVVTPFGIDTLDSSREIRLEGPWVGIVLEF